MANAIVDSQLLFRKDLASFNHGPNTLGALSTAWHMEKCGSDSAGMLHAIHSSERQRRLLVMKVRDGFTMAILLLGRFRVSENFHKEHRVRDDTPVGGGQKVYVFALTSSYRRKFEASEGFRLCLCKDLLQLYKPTGKEEFTKDAVGGSTFVYLKGDASFAKGRGKGPKGKTGKVAQASRTIAWKWNGK